MNISDHVIKQSELPHRLVLDYETTNALGRVSELWLDPQAHAVIGLTSQKGIWGQRQYVFPWERIRNVGKDSILVNAQGLDTKIEKPESVAPIVGHELWTDDGSKVGHIIDYLIDPDTGAVVSYLFKSKGWSGLMEGIYYLPPDAIASVGHKRLIARADAIHQSEKHEEGFGEKIASAQGFIKDDLEQTKQDFATVAEQGQTLADRLKEATQTVAGQVKETLSHGEHSSDKES